MTGKKKSVLRTVGIIAVSLVVWCGACFVCYAYGMRQETSRLTEMLDPDLAEQADSLKWVMAVEEPMTDEEIREKTKRILEDIEFQVKCFGVKNDNGEHITWDEALAAGIVAEADTAAMKEYTTSDPERGWGLRVVESPMGTVTYRTKDESVTKVTRNYTPDAPNGGPVNTPTEAVERARTYYNWGLPFPTNYDMVGAVREGDTWVVTYNRTARQKNLPKLRSDSQQVVLTISAQDGELIQATCLDLLLIQSGTDQHPIEEEQAVRVAGETLAQYGVADVAPLSASFSIVEPNFIYSKRADGHSYDPETHLSRAVWNVTYIPTDKAKEGSYQVYVDAYTGQQLGGFINQ